MESSIDQILSDYLKCVRDPSKTGSDIHDFMESKYASNFHTFMEKALYREALYGKPNTINLKVYEYMTTFTLKDKEYADKLKDLVTNRFAKRAALSIIEFHYSEEHKDTNYHIHCVYRTSKPMKKNRLEPYSRYGYIDHQPCRSWQDAITYINKENPSHAIVGENQSAA